jgi:SAM-dependent methyltransferase
VGSSFDATAAIYDRSRRQLIPYFDDLYRADVELAPFGRDEVIDVLDLGAGTGLMAAFLGQGLGTDEIGARLKLSRATERNHADRLRQKLGAHSRIEALVRAGQLGIA